MNKLDTFQNNMGEKLVKVGLGFDKKRIDLFYKGDVSIITFVFVDRKGVICFFLRTQCTIFNRMQLRKYDVKWRGYFRRNKKKL